MKRLILISTLLFNASAFAALGDHEQVVSSDAIKLKSSRAAIVQRTSSYSVHEMETPIAKVREYIDNNGLVFAVSWRGIRRPDLSVLLGSFYEEYNNIDSRRARMVTRAPVSIQTSRIQVRKSGHMRDIQGLAVITDQLPAGVRVEDLQ